MSNPVFGAPAASAFGSATPATSTATSLFGSTGGLFGTKPASTTTPSLFGTPAATTPAFGAAISTPAFGSATATPAFGAATATPAFGAATATPAFGAATATPAFGAATATPAFGAATATPAFGAATVAPAFGAATGTPAFGAATGTPAFGAATATPAFGAATATPAFGATTATPAFGAATTTPAFGATTATPTFGATTSTPAFGATSAAPAFGATTATPAFGTGLTSTPATTTSAFGAAATPSLGAAPSTGLNLTSTANTKFGIGTSTSTAAPGFGTGLATTTASTGFGSLGVTATSAPSFATGLSFGATTTTSATPSFGFGTTTAATAPSAGFNLGATATSTPASTSAPVGLGGLVTTQTKVVTTQKDVTPKDQPLPNEILQNVEGFKEFVKQQKIHSSDIARCSVRDYIKVEQDIKQLTQLLSEVESQLQKNRQLAEKLKYDTAKCLRDVEIAQRTQDTPPGLQYENTAPLQYFLNLSDKFERDMQILKVQIEAADNYIKNFRSPSALTPADLHIGMRKLHESFVALAGRLHSVHNQVESQKEAYLYTRKHLFNDHTNPFEDLSSPWEDNFKQILVYSPPKVATGPTPFSHLALGMTHPLGSQQNQSTIPYTTPTTNTNRFSGETLFGGSSLAQNTSGFQLQKPPVGNKRGKQ